MSEEPVMSPCPWCEKPVLDPCNFASHEDPGMWGIHRCPHCQRSFVLWESEDESVTLEKVPG